MSDTSTYLLSKTQLPFERLQVFFSLKKTKKFREFSSPLVHSTKPHDPLVIKRLLNISNAKELVEHWNYPFESHTTLTVDGYELVLHRIPFGHESKPITNSRPVVLIWHGLAVSSDVFVCHPTRDRNLAFLLADAGFDVWLGNSRGNKYSKGHQDELFDSMDKNQKKSSKSHLKAERIRFYDFCIDHIAKYDVPAAVRYITSTTQRPTLSYIGYSQGTTQVFASLSLYEEMNQMIDCVIALAPAIRPKKISNQVVNSIISKFQPKVLFPILGTGSFLPFVHTVKKYAPSSAFAWIIEHAITLFFGWECEKFGPLEQRKVFYTHLFSDAAVANLVHWFQIMENEEFAHYDQHENSYWPKLPTHWIPKSHALKFPTRHITTELHLFCGELDTISDLSYLQSHLPNETKFHIVQDYEHMDFLFASCAKEKCYEKVISILKEKQLELQEAVNASAA